MIPLFEPARPGLERTRCREHDRPHPTDVAAGHAGECLSRQTSASRTATSRKGKSPSHRRLTQSSPRRSTRSGRLTSLRPVSTNGLGGSAPGDQQGAVGASGGDEEQTADLLHLSSVASGGQPGVSPLSERARLGYSALDDFERLLRFPCGRPRHGGPRPFTEEVGDCRRRGSTITASAR